MTETLPPIQHSDDDDTGGDIEDSASVRLGKRKKRSSKPESLRSKGALFGIMYDLFRDFASIINIGLNRRPDAPDENFDDIENTYYRLFIALIKLVPDLRQQIDARGRDGIIEVADELEGGRTSMRNASTYAVKTAVPDWDVEKLSKLPRTVKIHRGFNHDYCGFMLCPVGYDWSDTLVQTALRQGLDSHRAWAEDFPYMLWEDGICDKQDFLKGFCRNLFMIKAAVRLLFGPEAGQKATIDGPEEARAAGSQNKARAHRWRVRECTLGLIATSAVLVHFAFSSQEVFGPGSSGGKWPYEEFHQKLLLYLETRVPEDKRTELLRWWNRQVFGRLRHDHTQHTTTGPPSVMQLMMAQTSAEVPSADATTTGNGSTGQ